MRLPCPLRCELEVFQAARLCCAVCAAASAMLPGLNRRRWPHLVLLHGCREMRLQRLRDCKWRHKWFALLLQGLPCAPDWRDRLHVCELFRQLAAVVEAHLLEAGPQRYAAAAVVMGNGCASCKRVHQPLAFCGSDHTGADCQL
jgi:hypothetical protein